MSFWRPLFAAIGRSYVCDDKQMPYCDNACFEKAEKN